jgi:proteasome lid subunit RPN8/RPN11
MDIKENFVFPVYIDKNILDKIKILCKSSKLEIFGYLVGNILKWKGKTYITIVEQLFITGAVHSNEFSTAQIEGTSGKYETTFQKIKKERNDDNLRITGWWHSHPNYGCFLSTTDIQTQRFFFPESYQVALVVDPIRDEYEFFTLEKNSNREYKSLSFAIIDS